MPKSIVENIRKQLQALEGRTIKRAFYMDTDVSDSYDWDEVPVVLELDDGTTLYASRDPEQNGPGTLIHEGGPEPQMLAPLEPESGV